MQRINVIIVICVLSFTFLNVSPADIKADVPLNIVVIIDTSDRLSKKTHPDQREKDIYILNEIVDQFYQLVQPYVERGGEIPSYRLTFAVPKQYRVPDPPNEIMDKLTIKAPKDRNGNPAFQKRKEELIAHISKLYDHVEQHSQTGSDIWYWFKSQAENYFSKKHQNLIICLSDGYLNFDNDIEEIRPKRTYMRVGALRNDPEVISNIEEGNEGLLPVGNFSDYNLKFLMLEIRLREKNGVPHFQDSEIIQVYWKTWLNGMGIEDTKFSEQLGLGGLKNEVERFIQSK